MTRLLRPHVLALATLTVAVLCMAADAQPPRGGQRGPGGPGRGPGPGMRGGPGGGGVLGLLRSEQVQEEVKLNDEQKTQIRQIIEKQMGQMRERFAGIRDLSEEERTARFEKFREEAEKRGKETEKQIAKILKPAQFKRLKQIELQQQGIMALMRPDIGEALGLSDEQKQKIQQIMEDLRKKNEAFREEAQGLFQGFRDLSQEDREKLQQRMGEFRQKGQKLQQEAQRKAMAVLTAEQKEELGNLMGEPFKLEPRRPPEGRRGGPGTRGSGGDRERRPQRQGAGQRGQRPRGERPGGGRPRR